MAEAENDSTYHIRVRGRVFGPFTVKQLDKLRARGQFSQSNEISTDGISWEPASSLEALFGTTKKKSASGSSEFDQPAVDEDRGPLWHYSIDGQQRGRASTKELNDMLDSGQMNLNDMVWKDGMSRWDSIANLREFQRTLEPTKRSSKRSSSSKSDIHEQVKQSDFAPHFLDHFIGAMRSFGGTPYVRSSERVAVEVGRYAAYLTMCFGFVFYLLCAIKFNQAMVGVSAFVLVLVGLALQYSAIKSCGALTRLVRGTQLRLSSMMLIDSMIIILIVAGIVGLIAFTVIAIRENEIVPLLIGVATFLVCELLGFMLLSPGAIQITISDQVGPGEEAIGLLSFFIMLPLRSTPSVFGLGTSISALGYATAIVLLFTTKKTSDFDLQMSLETAHTVGIYSLTLATISMIWPLLSYGLFLLDYLYVDILRSILIVPSKLDQVSAKIELASRESTTNTESQSHEFVQMAAE